MTKEDVSELGPVDYFSTEVPAKYKCGKCGVTGVKLWRDYNTFLSNQSLRCGKCSCEEQSKPDSKLSIAAKENGKVDITYDPDPHHFSGSGDQIGWRIPAVPTKDGETYWGYTSVPKEGCDWWTCLPLNVGYKVGKIITTLSIKVVHEFADGSRIKEDSIRQADDESDERFLQRGSVILECLRTK